MDDRVLRPAEPRAGAAGRVASPACVWTLRALIGVYLLAWLVQAVRRRAAPEPVAVLGPDPAVVTGLATTLVLASWVIPPL